MTENATPAPQDTLRCVYCHHWTTNLNGACGPCALFLATNGRVPAGPPLHEPTDRDADNVPSDRVATYAEALQAQWDEEFAFRSLSFARAVMAVADREQAALRAELAVLRQAHAGACCEFCDASTLAQLNRAEKAEAECARLRATIARVEALHVQTSTEFGPDYCPACSDAVLDWVVWPCATVRALRGPEPTEDGA